MTKDAPSPETKAPRPPRPPSPRAQALASLAGIQWRAIECLAKIIEEPYTGDENADTNLRKAKVTAANSLLSVATGFLKEARWKS
jgi:hypothetical protein